jgi:GntR family transcriptional regulator
MRIAAMAVLGRGPIPYYHQISSILRDKFANGEFVADERLPSEEQFQTMFGVSRATVRQALQALEHEGLINRIPGKGSFVAAPKNAIAEVKMTCLLEDLIALGIPGRNVVSDVGLVSAGRAIAEAMKLQRGDRVFTFQRLVMVDGTPFASHRAFLPVSTHDRLHEKDLADPHLLRTLAEKCDLHAETAEHAIEAVLADSHQSDLLGVDPGTALLSVTRTAFDKAGTPIEYGNTLYRSDRTRFHITQRQRAKQSDDWALASRGPRGAKDVRHRLSKTTKTTR